MDVPADPEAEYRAAEVRLLAAFGLPAPTERMVDVPGEPIRLHAIELAGDAHRTPVVLLHGIAAVTAAAVPLIPAFGGRRVVAPDWPGHGLSSAGGPDRAELRGGPVRWLAAVLDDAGIDRAHLVAHSMGGQFASYFALAHPERVASIVYLGAPGAAFPGMRVPAAMRLLALPGLAGLATRPVDREQYERNSAITLGPGAVQPWPRELVDCGWFASLRPEFRESLPRYYSALAGFFGVRRSAVLTTDELAALRMPVLALWGDADVFMTVPVGRASAERIPGAEFVEVAGGHAPWLNSPDAAAEAVRSFLDRVDG